MCLVNPEGLISYRSTDFRPHTSHASKLGCRRIPQKARLLNHEMSGTQLQLDVVCITNLVALGQAKCGTAASWAWRHTGKGQRGLFFRNSITDA